MSPGAYKKQFRKSTIADWIAGRKKLRAAQVQLLRYKKTKIKNPTSLHSPLLTPHETKYESLREGAFKVKARVHTGGL
jgi:hypothetical protein